MEEWRNLPKHTVFYCDLKVSSSERKIDENFANHFLKFKANSGGVKSKPMTL